MKRAIITIAATVAGTAGVLAYNPAAHTAVEAAADAATSSSSQAPTLEGDTSDDSGDSGSTDSGSSSGSGSSDSGSGSSGSDASGSEAVTGTAFSTRWGDVQVAVTFDGTTIVDVQALSMPSNDGHSMMLSQRAEQILREEVLQAQSADVDMVSGATFTSMGYLQSVQSALDAHNA